MLSRNRRTGNVNRWSKRFDNNISNHIKSSLFQHTTDVEDRGQASKSWRGARPRFTGSIKTTKDEHYLATTTNRIFTIITVKLRCLRQVATPTKSKSSLPKRCWLQRHSLLNDCSSHRASAVPCTYVTRGYRMKSHQYRVCAMKMLLGICFFFLGKRKSYHWQSIACRKVLAAPDTQVHSIVEKKRKRKQQSRKLLSWRNLHENSMGLIVASFGAWQSKPRPPEEAFTWKQ